MPDQQTYAGVSVYGSGMTGLMKHTLIFAI
jgi:hypothetical protein